ncbi:Transglutaminase-like enzyme, putative cysteine protease [Loktanella fryxellensis]|uniref:Transglutaminase-like enzyme, putative cysteine protease n=1 Tax=Loktanella fryxellensis TaxID=245187 RepID=A0A1H8CLB7_9RHOB|nr:transglutaminase family protein [Loktanella fryxellensis]SEM95830.1 Transglutaminase-like enzyme, putative cysteine protease [Loktanella fryxellensis]
MDLRITHTTRYDYDQPVGYALQRLRLRPPSNGMQTVQDWTVTVTGGVIELTCADHHGNVMDLVNTTRGSSDLVITASGTVTTHDKAGVLGKVYGAAPLWHFEQASPLTEPSRGIRTLAKPLKVSTNLLADLHTLSATILSAVPYATGQTYMETTAEEALAGAVGVCQDHAHIMIATARVAGLPARYVSGYLMMDDRVDQDASHAWAEVHLPTLGWVGFDVSNGISPDTRYVRLAVGRDARDAAPVQGLRMGPGDESLIVTLQVQQ